jgi:transcriptional regulator with PAS, ATPase and Fis domain
MNVGAWVKEFPCSVTVCDTEGKILEMNEKACRMFQKDGGAGLIGKNLLDCHPQQAGEKIKEMLSSQSVNCYTIEKNGIKKMIYQAPWYQDGRFMGLVELGMEIPFDLPHYLRK